jgi:subtilase family serine protease
MLPNFLIEKIRSLGPEELVLNFSTKSSPPIPSLSHSPKVASIFSGLPVAHGTAQTPSRQRFLL